MSDTFENSDLLKAVFNCLLDRIDGEFFPVDRETIQEHMEKYQGQIEDEIYQLVDSVESSILAYYRVKTGAA